MWSEAGAGTGASIAQPFRSSDVIIDAPRYTWRKAVGLAADWRVSGELDWQLAAQPLISNEQFSLGGVESVRGYLESAALGDNGAAFQLEAVTPDLASRLGGWPGELRLHTFFDAGRATVREPITAVDHATLAGTGVGLRAKAPGGVVADLEWAVALRDLGRTEAGDGRAHFRLGVEW